MGLSPESLALLEYATDMRRALHRTPERGLEEQDSQRFILKQLNAIGIDAEAIAGTGVKAVLRGSKPGPVTALRADMDALNVCEKTGCDFASEREGWMHACGHDGHMAALLATARLLKENLEQVSGTVVLLFQPCEELVKGARMLMEAGALDSPAVDRVFAFHLMPHLPEGTIGVVPGPVMAAACEFSIDVTGRSAHGAMPHLAVDAIAAAAAFVTGAQAVISRVKPPEAP
jgi:amidohydrolase